jgi:hypothetical protein
VAAYDDNRCHACEGNPYAAHADWCPQAFAAEAAALLAEIETKTTALEQNARRANMPPGSWKSMGRERFLLQLTAGLAAARRKAVAPCLG